MYLLKVNIIGEENFENIKKFYLKNTIKKEYL